jgi:hypothetical protein
MNEDLKVNEHMQEEMRKEISLLRQELDSVQNIRNSERNDFNTLLSMKENDINTLKVQLNQYGEKLEENQNGYEKIAYDYEELKIKLENSIKNEKNKDNELLEIK